MIWLRIDSRPPTPFEHVPTHQHAATGGGRRSAVGIVRPAEGVEQSKEVDEGRHQQPLEWRDRPQMRHYRREIQVLVFGRAYQPAEEVGWVGNVSVGQEDVVALAGQLCGSAGVHGPDFACPAVGKRRRRDYVDAASVGARAEAMRNVRGAIGA